MHTGRSLNLILLNSRHSGARCRLIKEPTLAKVDFEHFDDALTTRYLRCSNATAVRNRFTPFSKVLNVVNADAHDRAAGRNLPNAMITSPNVPRPQESTPESPREPSRPSVASFIRCCRGIGTRCRAGAACSLARSLRRLEGARSWSCSSTCFGCSYTRSARSEQGSSPDCPGGRGRLCRSSRCVGGSESVAGGVSRR